MVTIVILSCFMHDRSEFGQNVAEEYLKFFDFENVPLDQALRLMLPQ